jgi:hypothetical protein
MTQREFLQAFKDLQEDPIYWERRFRTAGIEPLSERQQRRRCVDFSESGVGGREGEGACDFEDKGGKRASGEQASLSAVPAEALCTQATKWQGDYYPGRSCNPLLSRHTI